jgi:hypothetical protein
MAAPIGNQYGHKDKKWRRAIERALEKRSLVAQMDALDELAEVLLQQCAAGDMTALKELGDRLDGKAAQAMELSGKDGGAIIVRASTGDERL